MRKQTEDAPRKVGFGTHVCVDLKPLLPKLTDVSQLLVPNSLTQVGPLGISLGGLVKGGVTASKLGLPAVICCPVGNDPLGRLTRDLIAQANPALADGVFTCRRGRADSSYSVVVEPGDDRNFWHRPGANDIVRVSDIPFERLADVCWMHLGYLNLMRQMWLDAGREMVKLLRRLKKMDIITSLDLTALDPESEAGKQNWRAILGNVLPHVDVFMPSFGDLKTFGFLRDGVVEHRLRSLSVIGENLLALGAAIAVIKLGKNGIYIRVTSDQKRLQVFSNFPQIQAAAGREFIVPAYRVKAVATTGAGDRANAALISYLVIGEEIEKAARAGAACGAHSVSQLDPAKADPDRKTLERIIKRGDLVTTESLDAKRLRDAGFIWDSSRKLWRTLRDSHLG